MAEIDNTTSGIVWQWLSEHKQDVLDFFASMMREASDIQLLNFDPDRHMGVLATFVYQGVRRVDNVRPASLLEGLTSLNDALRIRCENAASEAETQAAYAKVQGDRVDAGILDLTNLKNTVAQQGNTAQQQGVNAQNICDQVTAWYTPFKNNAEDWIDTTKADWNDWYPTTQGNWNEWYAARQQQWLAWYTNGIVPDWNAFWAGVQSDWSDWTEKELARQRAELERIANELLRVADEEVRRQKETERQQAETIRQQKESERQQNEDEREGAEVIRQNTFETNEAKRQQDFIDAEGDRMASMLLTHFWTDPETMISYAVKPKNDDITYTLDEQTGIQYAVIRVNRV